MRPFQKLKCICPNTVAMDNAAIPEDIRRFVLTSIPSVPFLEALLLMRAAPEQPWSRWRVRAEIDGAAGPGPYGFFAHAPD